MGCKYLTETKEALDCSKNEVLPPPLASFYFQRYFKVHWVARTDFIVKHETFQGMFSEKLFRWEKNNGTQNRAVAWTLVMQTRAAEDLPAPWCCVCAAPPTHHVSQCPCYSQAPNQGFPRQRQLQHYPAGNNWLGSRATTAAKKDHF